MVLDKDVAGKTAELLLQISAIKLNTKTPYKWASGWNSPIYCDNRIILSYPPIRNFIRENLSKQLEALYGKPDLLVGVATGGIGIGVLAAEYLGLPFAYVRPQPKAHGRKNNIEGVVEGNPSVVVIEDLISTGKSSLQAVNVLSAAGARVKGVMAIFSYGFSMATKNFEKKETALNTLSDYDHLLEEAIKASYITKDELDVLTDWRSSPEFWKAR